MSSRRVQVLYATVSGNAEAVARAAAAQLEAAGWPVAVGDAADFPASELVQLENLLVIASTWGDGAPPPEAEPFVAALEAEDAASLPQLRYAVLALGSSSYPEFCACGRRIDEALARRGARRLRPRVDCDVKFREAAARWTAALPALLAGQP